jgi:hypothetical protein
MKPITMKRVCIFILAASSCAFAQADRRVWVSQNGSPGPVTDAGPVTIRVGGFEGSSGGLVQGAPYSATITNQSVQMLADGNRIVQNSTGTIARDSQGRTRQDTSLPAIGNLSAANAPHLVFIHDPVAQTSYTLNLTDKTAHKMPPMPPPPPGGPGPEGSDTFFIQMGDVATASGQLPPPLLPMARGKVLARAEQGQVSKEDLGSQTMEALFVTGVRTTRTIPAGQIGNEKPITVITEVWTSPDLKTIVYSKRSDPRMGEQIFQLTNITRTEPDGSLFTVPADFKIVEGPKPIVYRPNQ